MNSMKLVIPLHFISWKKTRNDAVTPQRFRICFHLWCELTSTINVTELGVSWNSWYTHFNCINTISSDWKFALHWHFWEHQMQNNAGNKKLWFYMQYKLSRTGKTYKEQIYCQTCFAARHAMCTIWQDMKHLPACK